MSTNGDWIKNNILAVGIRVVTVIVLILNLWLGLRIAPLSQDIAVLEVKVLANERNITYLGDRLETRLDGLEKKLDNALEFIYTK